MIHPTLEDAARALSEHLANDGLSIDAGDGKGPQQVHLFLADEPMAAARAVLLSIRPPDGFEVTLKEQMAREYIDAVLRSGE